MNIFDAKQQFYLDLHFFSPVSEKYVIYFLLDNNEVVYVGKSSDDRYMGRIRKHRKDKLFDSYAVAATNLTERQCLEFETSLISLMQPKYNKKDSFFNLLRVVNGINTYYGANKLHSIPAKEQEDAAARSYLEAQPDEITLHTQRLRRWNRQRNKTNRRRRRYFLSLYQNVRTGQVVARNSRQLRLQLRLT